MVSVQETDKAGEGPRVIGLTRHAFARQAVDNMGWVDIGGSVVVVDALEQRELEDEVFAALQQTVGGMTVSHVVNTHTHYDHVALNDAFVRRYGAEVVNHQTWDFSQDKIVLEGERECAEIIPLGDVHSDHDSLVWFAQSSVLFVGDLFGWGLIPYEANLRPEKQKLVVDTYDRMIALDAKYVVAGHGPVLATSHLKRWLTYFQESLARARELAGEGRGVEEIEKQIAPPDDMRSWWRFLAWKHEDTMNHIAKAAVSGW